MRALIIVDVQNDFCSGGSVPVAGADALACGINDYLDREPGYHHVVATQDYHISPGHHFSREPNYSTSWPPHCGAGSFGAEFHPDLDLSRVEAVFRKGAYDAGYSGFEGIDENDTRLVDWLRLHRIEEVDVVGVATDYCVRMTSEDAVGAGFATRVLLDLTVGAGALSTMEAIEEMGAAGVSVVSSS